MKEYPCLLLKQGSYSMFLFSISAKELFNLVDINRRDENKRTGYQRILNEARTSDIAKFIDAGNPIPTNIVVAFDQAKFNEGKTSIQIEEGGKAGWVIDGQHRLAGAFEAVSDIQLPVTGFLDINTEAQIEQFIVINKEAKKVPTSLYLDLLPNLKTLKKTDAELAKERAVDLANNMKIEEASPFYNRIAVLKSPSKGQISLTNWVRKIAPLVHRTTGVLRSRTELQQRGMIENFFGALNDVFPAVYDENDSVFFKTLGFGALMNAFPMVHDLTLNRTPDSFQKSDLVETLKPIANFPFHEWKTRGTGSSAEILAGDELRRELDRAWQDSHEEKNTLKL